jgi:hypothetical protein
MLKLIECFQAELVQHSLLYPLLRNESATCLRAVPPEHRRIDESDDLGEKRREEQSQMLNALARALHAVNHCFLIFIC